MPNIMHTSKIRICEVKALQKEVVVLHKFYIKSKKNGLIFFSTTICDDLP